MNPPVLADWLLLRLVPRHLRSDIVGDLHEEWQRLTLDDANPLRARFWYWHQVLMSPFHYRIARGQHTPRRNVEQQRARRSNTLLWIESVLSDLRYAARSLRRSPGFAIVAISSQFQSFLRALAARAAQLQSLSDLAPDLGVAVNTVKAWISVLRDPAASDGLVHQGISGGLWR